MKRYSLNVWNDWKYLSRYRMDVTFFRLSGDYLPGEWASIDLMLLGFGISLTSWSRQKIARDIPAGIKAWGDAINAPVENQGREA